jgi:hypothetical protein
MAPYRKTTAVFTAKPGKAGDELYTDDAAVEAHRAAPYFQNDLSGIGDLAARAAVTSHPVDVI